MEKKVQSDESSENENDVNGKLPYERKNKEECINKSEGESAQQETLYQNMEGDPKYQHMFLNMFYSCSDNKNYCKYSF